MSISISPIAPAPSAPAQIQDAKPIVGGEFSHWINHEMLQLNATLQKAETGLRALALGEQVNLHDVMMTLEQAKLSFQLALTVRNKLLESYQDLMRTQL